MFPTFKFVLELLLICINSHLMQEYCEQSEWPDIKELALICNEQVSQFNAWWSLISLLLKATRPVVCLQASQGRGRDRESGSASSSTREVRRMSGKLWQYVWGLITLNANKGRNKNSPLSFFLFRPRVNESNDDSMLANGTKTIMNDGSDILAAQMASLGIHKPPPRSTVKNQERILRMSQTELGFKEENASVELPAHEVSPGAYGRRPRETASSVRGRALDKRHASSDGVRKSWPAGPRVVPHKKSKRSFISPFKVKSAGSVVYGAKPVVPVETAKSTRKESKVDNSSAGVRPYLPGHHVVVSEGKTKNKAASPMRGKRTEPLMRPENHKSSSAATAASQSAAATTDPKRKPTRSHDEQLQEAIAGMYQRQDAFRQRYEAAQRRRAKGEVDPRADAW